MEHKVKDLRSALELLQTMPGQLVETHREVDPHAELAGVYRYVGAGGTVQRPTQEGPAMLFHTIKGHPGAKVAIGALASRKRVAARRTWESCCITVRRSPSPLLPYRERLPASRWSTGRKIRILIYTNWCPPLPTPLTTPGPTSPWGCATPPTRKPAPTT